MKKIIIGGAIAALTITTLSACGQQSWQEALEEEILFGEDALSGQEIDEFCAGIALFDIDSPERIGALILGFAEDEEIPPGNTTVREWIESEPDASLDDVRFDIDPDEVTVRDFADEVGEILLEQCESPAPRPGSSVQDEPSTEPEASWSVPVGSSALVGDWSLSVTEVSGNANDIIAAQNQFNDAPQGQYVLVTLSGTYSGEGSGDLWIDLSYQFVGNDGVVYDETSGVTQAENEDWPTEARAGATVQYQVLFDVPAAAISGGAFLVSDWTSWDDDEAEFALGL